MHVKRTATIVLGGGALAGWLAGAATSDRPLPGPIRARPPALDAPGGALANENAQLHERRRAPAAAHPPGRDVFRFQVRAPRPAPIVEAPRPALVEAPMINNVAPPPPLRLSGIAEDPGDAGPVRIAFITGDGQLYIAKEGEPVTPRYTVARISADAVELIDT